MENITATLETTLTKKEQIRLANLRISELEKSLAQEKTYKEMYTRLNNEKEAIINDVHDFLDGIEGITPKEKDNYKEHKLITRVASLMILLSRKA